MPTVTKPSQFKSSFGPLPKQVYTVQILDVKQGHNVNKKCPQDLFKLEIIAPDSVQTAEGEAMAAGRLADLYVTYSDKNLANCRDLLAKLGFETQGDSVEWTIPTEEEVVSGELTRIAEIQDLTRAAVGKQFDVVLQTSPQYKKVPSVPGGKAKWNDPDELDANGDKIVTGHRIDLPGRDDIQSPLR